MTNPHSRDMPVLRERDHILNTAKALISGERAATYGDAGEDFTRTGKMWAAVLGVKEVTAEQVALCMALVKIGRLCETPNHTDSWIDICGYAEPTTEGELMSDTAVREEHGFQQELERLCDCGLPAASGSNFCSDCLPSCRHGNVLAAVAEIRALHRPPTYTHYQGQPFCHTCHVGWPCPTITILNRAGCL